MPRRRRFTIIFAPETLAQLDVLERNDHRPIRQAIDKQLSFLPEQVTRNRKLLEQPAPFGAAWELRFGPENRFRVFYEVEANTRVINILAIGIKKRNKLVIGGEEFEP